MHPEGGAFLLTNGVLEPGAATARTLSKAGANAVICDLHGEAAAGTDTRFVETGVTDEASVVEGGNPLPRGCCGYA